MSKEHSKQKETGQQEICLVHSPLGTSRLTPATDVPTLRNIEQVKVGQGRDDSNLR